MVNRLLREYPLAVRTTKFILDGRAFLLHISYIVRLCMYGATSLWNSAKFSLHPPSLFHHSLPNGAKPFFFLLTCSLWVAD